ncbi:MAG: SMC family ATPase, partial [Cohaesibacter sp.]|nr:SMC family ATPase [Cohaesibacter sp.]
MKPLFLRMQGFGPYAGQENVDFSAALKSRVFGIYGATGSGKSSIFNGISFALFGETAKGVSDTTFLRSDHALPQTETLVEFVFDLGAKRYFVRRIPEYNRPKQRGDGVTTQKHEAWLFDVSGLCMDEIFAGKNSAVLAEKNVKQVKEQVQDLLGYGATQFRQIVLLPQGEFETFLISNTKDRTAILRQLFDVGLYQKFSQSLDAKAKELSKDTETARDVCQKRLSAEGFADMPALSADMVARQGDIEASQDQYAQLQQITKQAEAELTAAQQVEALFVEADKAKNASQKLEAMRPAIAQKEADVGHLTFAKSLADLDRAVRDAEATMTQASQQLEVAKAGHETAQTQADRAKETLAEESNREDQLLDLRQALADLLRHQETLTSAETLQQQYVVAQATRESTAAVLQKAQDALGQAESSSDDLKKQFSDARIKQQ